MFGVKYDEDLGEFAEQVKEQGDGKVMAKKLVFDPATGQFKTVSKLNLFSGGEVVTEMTEKGFA